MYAFHTAVAQMWRYRSLLVSLYAFLKLIDRYTIVLYCNLWKLHASNSQYDVLYACYNMILRAIVAD